MRQQMPQGKEITTPADADSNKQVELDLGYFEQ
jgi:hypothetical protein